MTDVLVYSKDFEATSEPHYWHSNAKVFGSLIVGDRLWVVPAAGEHRSSCEYQFAVNLRSCEHERQPQNKEAS